MTTLQLLSDIYEEYENEQLLNIAVVHTEIPNLNEQTEDFFELDQKDNIFPMPPNECSHLEIEFLHPGTGKYDIYRCKICKNTIVRNWA